MVLSGCAHERVVLTHRPPPLPEEVRERLDTVGLAPSRLSPRLDMRNVEPPEGLGGGRHAEGGALAGASVGTAGAVVLLPFGIIFPPILIAAGGLLVVSTVGGAAVGASQEPAGVDHRKDLQAQQPGLEDLFVHARVQRDLHQQLLEAGRGVPAIRFLPMDEAGTDSPDGAGDGKGPTREDMDAVLRASIEQVTVTAETGASTTVAMDLLVRATLVERGTGAELDDRTFTCLASRRSLPEWNAGGIQPIRDALSRCYARVSERIMEELFLVHVPESENGWEFGGKDFARVAAAGLRPTLTWTPFPAARLDGSTGQPEGPGVTYDLSLWRAVNGLPGELAYRRTGLATATHRIEDPLEPGATYFWSVRARFPISGRERVTPWAVMMPRAGYAPDLFDRVTHDLYYRFTVPPA